MVWKREGGGSISIQGSAVEAYTRKISRCVRSTTSAEGAAIANLIEGTFRVQSYTCELVLGFFFDIRVRGREPFFLENPFEDAPPNETAQDQLQKMEPIASVCGKCSTFIGTQVGKDFRAKGVCRPCANKMNFWKIYHTLGERALSDDSRTLQQQMMPPLKIIALTDSATAFASVANIQPRSVDKLTKLTLVFQRDISARVFFSFVDAFHNLADAGPQISGEVGICLRACREGEFTISFTGRKKLQQFLDAKRQENR